MIVPSLFIEVHSEPDKVKVQYSVERQRDLEKKEKDKMMKKKKRMKK